MENLRQYIREKFKDLFQNSLNYIIIYNLNGMLLDANDVILDTFGYNRDEIIDKPIKEFIYAEDIIQAGKALKELRKTGKISKSNIYRIKKKQSGFRYVEIHGTPIRKDNKIVAILGLGHDITEKRDAQLKLIESEERFRSLFKGGPLYTLAWQKIENDFILVDYNNTAEIIYGGVKDSIGNTASEMYLKRQSYPDFIADLNRCFEERSNFVKVRKVFVNFMNSERDLRVICNYVPPDLVLTHVEDITRRKSAEQKLRESEEKYRHLYDNSPFSIVLFDLKGTIIDYNSTLGNFLGYEKENIIGKNFLELGLFKPEMVPILKKRLIRYASGENVDPIELQIYKKDGTLAWVNPTVTLTHIGEEKVILIMFQDITERKKTEEKLEETEENYRIAYERENFYKDLFMHDMSNILQSMLMSLELCEYKINSMEAYHNLKGVINNFRQQIYRGANLVNNVRKFSEFYESNKLLKSVRVKVILEDAEKIVKSISNHKQVNIKYENLKEEYIIKADEFLINVFENILINAVKHNDHQFTETLVKFSEIQENGNKLLKIEFIDNGRGIPDFKKDSIFNRGDIKDRSVSGLGLGLSLVKSILDKYSAKIWVEDKVVGDHSHGSKFVLLFPLLK
ncbi:MAG: PAS domain S-box protein [Promethearchaeota archaeon]